MSEIIEIVYENINELKLFKFIEDLLINKELESFKGQRFDGGELDLNIDNEKEIRLFIEKFQIKEFEYIFLVSKQSNDSLFKGLNIWIQFDPIISGYDLYFSFEVSNLSFFIEHNLKKIKQISAELSKFLESRNYFCGLDPASDLETRFFTNQNDGPLARTSK